MMCRAIPYEGQEPYIFLSYCHKDADWVYPLLEQLVRDGYRVWYDDGNHPGDNWLENIAQHLSDCRVCIAMISEKSAASHNCRNEINFALENNKKLMAILLEDFVMPLGMRLQLGTIHYLKRKEYPSDHMLLQKLYETEEMKACRREPGKLPMWEIPRELEVWRESLNKAEVVDFVSSEEYPRIRTNIVPLPDEEPEPKPEPKVELEPGSESQSQPESQLGKNKTKDPVSKVKVKARVTAKQETEAEDKTEPAEEQEPVSQMPAEETPVAAGKAADEEVKSEPQPELEPAQAPEIDPVADEGEDEVTVYRDEKTIYGAAAGDDDDEDARTIRAEQHQVMVLLRMSNTQGYVLNSAQTQIGRSKKCDVVLADNPYIGGHHADIIQYKGRYYLRDMGSVNGSFVGEERIESEGQIQLKNQMVFRLYDETFVFFCGPEAQKLAAEGGVYFICNPKTQCLKLLKEDTLPLDRSHKWEDGTMRDLEISRNPHAAVSQREGCLYLEDKGHQNGVYLNGRRLSPNETCRLKSGDQIRMGQTVLEAGIVTL